MTDYAEQLRDVTRRTTHLLGSPDSRTKCGERAYAATVRQGVKDVTCFCCAQQWQRENAK